MIHIGKMDSINDILKKGSASKYTGTSRPVYPGRVNHEFQANALHIIEKLNIPRKRYSAYFAVCKRENTKFISDAFSFAVDHPIVEARDKMFFWKLNDLKKNYKSGINP